MDAVEKTEAKIRDTHKTLPGLQTLEKYTVRTKNGVNHRMSLSNATLVKNNHITTANNVIKTFELIHAAYPNLPLEIEINTVTQTREIIDANTQLVLLDNITPKNIQKIIQYADKRCQLKTSGKLRLNNTQTITKTNIDYLAINALTHSTPILDINLNITP